MRIWNTQEQAIKETPEEHTGVFQWNEGAWTVWWIEAQMGTNRWPQTNLIAAERIARRLLMDQNHILSTRMMDRGFTFRAFIRELKCSPSHHNALTVNPWTERIMVEGEKAATVRYALPTTVRDPLIREHLQDYHTIKRMLMQGAGQGIVAKMIGHPIEDVSAAIDLGA